MKLTVAEAKARVDRAKVRVADAERDLSAAHGALQGAIREGKQSGINIARTKYQACLTDSENASKALLRAETDLRSAEAEEKIANRLADGAAEAGRSNAMQMLRYGRLRGTPQ